MNAPTTAQICADYANDVKARAIVAAYTGGTLLTMSAVRGALWAAAGPDWTDSYIDALMPYAVESFRLRGILRNEQ